MADDKLAKTVAQLQGMLDGTYSPPPRPRLNPASDALFGGLARASLHCDAVELLPGLELRRTYAHVFAPAMVAFAPPPAPRAAHPVPWAPADGGGMAESVGVEVYLAKGAQPIGIGRLETILLVASLVRLLAASPVCMPVLCSMPFADVPAGATQPTLRALEPAPGWPVRELSITAPFVELLQHFLQPASVLLRDDDVFRAYSLADGMWWLPSWPAQMLALWTAAETLMRPGRNRTGAALADSIRAYLGRSRKQGDRLYNEVAHLYGARGSAAHAGKMPKSADMEASYRIVRDILLRCFAEGSRPPLRPDIVPLWAA